MNKLHNLVQERFVLLLNTPHDGICAVDEMMEYEDMTFCLGPDMCPLGLLQKFSHSFQKKRSEERGDSNGRSEVLVENTADMFYMEMILIRDFVWR